MSYKTTQKDLDTFRYECMKWIKYLGLKSWEVQFGFDEDGNRAACSADPSNRICLLLIGGQVWDKKPSVIEIRLCAFHEVIELLLSEYRLAAESRYTMSETLETLRHTIIATLENTMFVDINPQKRKGK